MDQLGEIVKNIGEADEEEEEEIFGVTKCFKKIDFIKISWLESLIDIFSRPLIDRLLLLFFQSGNEAVKTLLEGHLLKVRHR